MTKEIFASPDAAVMAAVESAPIGRWAQPDELAHAALLLASHAARPGDRGGRGAQPDMLATAALCLASAEPSFVNGAVYVVDGAVDEAGLVGGEEEGGVG